MYTIRLIKRIFVRQHGHEDCGAACLAMVLKLAAKTHSTTALRKLSPPPGGFSLWDLKELAMSHGLRARAAEMDLETLAESLNPSILHVVNQMGEEHYVVCFGRYGSSSSASFLIADPATQVHPVSRQELEKIWATKAALYFEDMATEEAPAARSRWRTLLVFQQYPRPLLIAVPLFSLATASFGVTLSWLLQRTMLDTSLLNGRIAFTLLAILLVISLFRACVNYIRHFILVKVELELYRYLSDKVLGTLFVLDFDTAGAAQPLLRNMLSDIQKIQRATVALISTVVSDGSLIILMLSVLAYLMPLAAVINILTIAGVFFLAVGQLHRASFLSAHTKNFSAASEEALVRDIARISAIRLAKLSGSRLSYHSTNQASSIRLAAQIAQSMIKLVLQTESMAAISVILVFLLALLAFQKGTLSFSGLMLVVSMTFIIGTLLPKLCNSLQIIDEGADAAVQLDVFIADNS